jgi:fission 1 protein
MLTFISPLKPAELQVLRSQFEKEGEHVGVQTKFNFAWVGAASRFYDLDMLI